MGRVVEPSSDHRLSPGRGVSATKRAGDSTETPRGGPPFPRASIRTILSLFKLFPEAVEFVPTAIEIVARHWLSDDVPHTRLPQQSGCYELKRQWIFWQYKFWQNIYCRMWSGAADDVRPRPRCPLDRALTGLIGWGGGGGRRARRAG